MSSVATELAVFSHVQPNLIAHASQPETVDHFHSPGTTLDDVDRTVVEQLGINISLSRTKSVVVVVTVSSMIFVGSLLTGVLTVGLPRIARDIHLQENLLLW